MNSAGVSKNDRIEAYIASLPVAEGFEALHPCFTGYITCFNREDFYEAHDVLEHLWLATTDDDHLFYKALIQFAGGFVHLRLQHAYPEHPKHGRRLGPARRLFSLAAANLRDYPAIHYRLDVASLRDFASATADCLVPSEELTNPWAPQRAPLLKAYTPITWRSRPL